MRLSARVCLLVLVLAVAIPLSAEDVSGHNIVVQEPPVVTKLANGSTFNVVTGTQICTMSKADHPLNHASGTCSGGCIIDADGNSKCMGSCTWVDQTGDLVFFLWDGTGMEGHWWLKGGTGKYENGSGEGTWKTDTEYAGGNQGNTWKGTINLK